MKKFGLICLFFNLHFILFTQIRLNIPILLFPSDKKAIIKIDNKTKELNASLLCDYGMQIEVIKGRVHLLSSSGKELIIEPGSKIILHDKKEQIDSQPIKKISRFIETPSVYFSNLNSPERNESIAFPLRSKVVDQKHISFCFYDEISSKAKIKIFRQNSDSLIWEKSEINKDMQLSGLEEGAEYFWKLYDGSNSIKGTFKILTKKEKNLLSLKSYRNKKKYLENFLILLENECFFDALAVLDEAKIKYPKSEIFKLLINNCPLGK